MKKQVYNNTYKKVDEVPKRQRGNHYDFLAGLLIIASAFGMKSSLVYFYANYILYSLLCVIVLLFLTFYWIPKLSIYKKLSIAVLLTMPFLYLVTTIWFIPKLIHYQYIDKQYQCFNAKLESKWFLRSDIVGSIRFDIDYTNDLPKEMMFINFLDGLDTYQYDNLPNKGEKIRICGEISKIGFSLESVEAVRDENVSGVP